MPIPKLAGGRYLIGRGTDAAGIAVCAFGFTTDLPVSAEWVEFESGEDIKVELEVSKATTSVTVMLTVSGGKRPRASTSNKLRSALSPKEELSPMVANVM